jgi:hypothetical protein
MNCPICNIELKPADRGGIEIDYCPRNIKFPVAEGTRFPVFGSNASLVVSTKLPFGDGTKVPKGWQPPRFAEVCPVSVPADSSGHRASGTECRRLTKGET